MCGCHIIFCNVFLLSLVVVLVGLYNPKMTLKIDEIDPYVCLQLLKKIDLQDLCFASCIYSLLIPKIQVL